MLETFYLRQNINQTKEELSHSLVANEASEKVIGRLLKEREEIDREVAKLQAELA